MKIKYPWGLLIVYAAAIASPFLVEILEWLSDPMTWAR